jgi:hypothetical protein
LIAALLCDCCWNAAQKIDLRRPRERLAMMLPSFISWIQSDGKARSSKISTRFHYFGELVALGESDESCRPRLRVIASGALIFDRKTDV